MEAKIITAVLALLKGKDPWNAMMVNSLWATAGREYKWRNPPCWALTALSQSKAQQHASMVRSLRVDHDDDRVNKLQERGLRFNELRRLYFNLTRLEFQARGAQLFLGAQLTHLTLVTIECPKELFKPLSTHCVGLRRLKITIGCIGDEHQEDAREDLRYLPVLLKNCTRLVEVSLRFDTLDLLPLQLSKDVTDGLIALPELKKLELWDLEEEDRKPLFNLRVDAFIILQSLEFTGVDARELARYLPRANSLKELRICLSSKGADGLLRVISAHVGLKALSIDLSSVTQVIAHDDFSALSSALDLESLSIESCRKPKIRPAFKNWDVLDLVASLPKLKRLEWNVEGMSFTSIQFKVLGVACPTLEFVNVPFILAFPDFEARLPSNAVMKRLRARGLNDSRVSPRGREPLFPSLRRIRLRTVEYPRPGTLKEDFEPPDQLRIHGEFMDYVEKLGDRAASFIMRQMPKVQRFVTSGDHVPLYVGFDYPVSFDVRDMWYETVQKAMLRHIRTRNGWYKNKGDEDDYAFEEIQFSDSEDEDSDMSDAEESKRILKARKM